MLHDFGMSKHSCFGTKKSSKNLAQYYTCQNIISIIFNHLSMVGKFSWLKKQFKGMFL